MGRLRSKKLFNSAPKVGRIHSEELFNSAPKVDRLHSEELLNSDQKWAGSTVKNFEQCTKS
jgi:hypothetical protein